jgi:hypothetical protein
MQSTIETSHKVATVRTSKVMNGSAYMWLELRTQEMHAEYYRDPSQSGNCENQQGDEWECLSDTA